MKKNKPNYSDELLKETLAEEIQDYRSELAELKRLGVKKDSWLVRLAEESHEVTNRLIKLQSVLVIQRTPKSEPMLNKAFLKTVGPAQTKLLTLQLEVLAQYHTILCRRLAAAHSNLNEKFAKAKKSRKRAIKVKLTEMKAAKAVVNAKAKKH